MKCGVVVFPGSNCDQDCYHILHDILELETEWVWHKDQELSQFDLVVLPGGFSYGDYLRAGSIARFSPIMKSVAGFAQKGGRVLGICNGFQILVESGLLPGALMDNQSCKFICRHLHIRVENSDTPFTSRYRPGQVIEIPVAHAQGNYFVDPETHQRLQDNGQIVFRYCGAEGETGPASNPNGSLDHIAGVINEQGNVLGMMPHPERAADPLWSQVDGRPLFESLLQSA